MSAWLHFGKGALSVEPVQLWAVAWCGFVNGAQCGSVALGSMTQLSALPQGGCLVPTTASLWVRLLTLPNIFLLPPDTASRKSLCYILPEQGSRV